MGSALPALVKAGTVRLTLKLSRLVDSLAIVVRAYGTVRPAERCNVLPGCGLIVENRVRKIAGHDRPLTC